jgi:hypothetical protein
MESNVKNEELRPLIENENSCDTRSANLSNINEDSFVIQNRDNANQSIPHSTRTLSAIFITVNATLGTHLSKIKLNLLYLRIFSSLGAGLLNIPHAFNESGGILYATIIQTVSHRKSFFF